MSLIAELKRRNVFRVAAAYAVVAWLLVQIAATVLPMFGAPDWIARALVVALAIGVVPMLVLAWAFEFTPEGLKTQAQADAAGLSSRFSGARLNLAIGALLLLAIGLFFLGRYSAGPERADAPDAGAAGEPSIAVLPFVNMSADKDNEYFSDGLSETLLNMLAQIPDLKVAGRTSSFAFKGKNEDLRKVGAALGVANVLEGSVQKSGDMVRITAQLIAAGDGHHRWSKSYDRKLTDVFRIQDEIATEVVGALKVTLVGDSERRLTQKRTDNIDAYQEYLKGLALLPRRKVAELRQAALHFERAIELDPGFARAYVGASDTYLLLSEYGSVDAEQRARRERYIERALELAPDLGEAHASRAVMLAKGRDLAGAEREYRRALELAPNYATAHQWYAEMLKDGVARYDEALEHSERAAALDPLSPVILFNLSDSQRDTGRIDQSRATLARLRSEHPGYALAHRAAAQVAADAGDMVGALRAMDDYDRADPEGIGYAVGRCDILLSFGAIAEARACIDRFAARAPDQDNVRTAQARLQASNGDVEGALAIFQRHPGLDPIEHAVTLLQAGRGREALALVQPLFPALLAEPAPEVAPRDRNLALVLGVILVHAGERAHGEALLARALASEDSGLEFLAHGSGVWTRALCLAALQRRDEAYAELERAVRGGAFADLSSLDLEPLLADFRADPRYERIVAPARVKAAEQVRLARAAGLL